MNIEKKQQSLVATIVEELTRDNPSRPPSSYRHSVWFQPLSGRFLYDDTYIKYEVVEPLIENGILVFKSIGNHQGEKMLRYVLSPNFSFLFFIDYAKN
jgi:hypothetical protein